MQKGFGSSDKKKILKDSRYLKFYNNEKYAEHLFKNKKNKEAKALYLMLLKSGYQSYNIFLNLGFIELSFILIIETFVNPIKPCPKR